MTISNLECTGVSGFKYLYAPVPPNPVWSDLPANYLFCHWNGQAWVIQYAGETDSLGNRMPSHDRWEEAVSAYGVTQIFSHINQSGGEARKREERDIIQAYNPPMNVQHRTAGTGILGAGASVSSGIFPLAHTILNGRR